VWGGGVGARHSVRGLRSGRQHRLGQCRHRPRHGGVCRREYSPLVAELLITADAGGSNGARVRLWKVELQKLADRLRLPISVCHFPPGTSKWNKIEHRLFSFISQNWRGPPPLPPPGLFTLISPPPTPPRPP